MKAVLQGLFFCLVTTAFFFFYPAEKKTDHPLSRGWGADIEWVQSYEEGLFQAKTREKPLMVIHHLMDCPYSKALKELFSQHEEIQKIAKEDFIMMNVMGVREGAVQSPRLKPTLNWREHPFFREQSSLHASGLPWTGVSTLSLGDLGGCGWPGSDQDFTDADWVTIQ
ncbi:AGR3 protein, partial [Polyodon spathula]|nr:AGR3 protein [Polyodon spathula]